MLEWHFRRKLEVRFFESRVKEHDACTNSNIRAIETLRAVNVAINTWECFSSITAVLSTDSPSQSWIFFSDHEKITNKNKKNEGREAFISRKKVDCALHTGAVHEWLNTSTLLSAFTYETLKYFVQVHVRRKTD